MVQDALPGIAVAVYPVTAALPLATGAVQETTADAAAGAAATPVGAPGTGSCGVPDTAADVGPAPNRLVAVTVSVYVVPLASALNVQVVAAVVQVAPPGLEVTV